MKIAFVAPVIRYISTKNLYGGIERIISSLVFGAAETGHKVVLYAPYGTDLKHQNLEVRLSTDKDITGMTEAIAEAEKALFERLIIDQEEFDLIHSHIEPFIAKNNNGNYFSQIKKPVVTTVHNQTYIDEHIDYYRSHQDVHGINFVFISHDQAHPLNFLPKKTVIYNGIDLTDFDLSLKPVPDKLAFLGRITPEKGIVEAIEIAKTAGKNLFIGAAIDPTKEDYFEKEVKPRLVKNKIVYLGEITNEARNDLLSTSEALLFPIQWHEPFGLVIVEAMASGTPVIASDIGSVSEIIEDNKTGFIFPAKSVIEESVKKLKIIDTLDRKYCREQAEERFTESIMVKKYLDYYSSLL